MTDIEKARQYAKALRDMADATDKLADLGEREKAGEDVTEEMETAIGRLMVAAVKIQGESPF